MEWPPNYGGELDRRLRLEHRLTAEPDLLNGALLRYAQDPAAFISDCVYLHEPRNANTGEPVMLPVVLFPRQQEFIAWLHERFTTKTSAPGREVA
jgi:phage terminase large subunit